MLFLKFTHACLHLYAFTLYGYLGSLTHTCKHTCRVWAMQYNKQRGSDVVSFAPCAVVEKPHEGFWVLKDKPWLAGRESVMQQENCVFHPFFLLLISSWTLFSLPLFPSSVFYQILSPALPTFFPPSFISFILWHIRLSCNTLHFKITTGMFSQRRGWTWGGAGQTSITN